MGRVKTVALVVCLVVGLYLGIGWAVTLVRDDCDMPGWAAVLCLACLAGVVGIALS